MSGQAASRGTAAREAQLLNTVQALQRALDKCRRETETGISSSKYMQARHPSRKRGMLHCF